MRIFKQSRDVIKVPVFFKYIVVKKISLCVFLLFVLITGFAQTNVLQKRVSITFKELTLQKALDKLENETGISVAYSNKLNVYKEKINSQT